MGTLGTFTWEPGNLYLGTFTWEPLLGNLYLEPGNLGGMGFGAAPVCSETFTMAEDPKAFCCWGKMMMVVMMMMMTIVMAMTMARMNGDGDDDE